MTELTALQVGSEEFKKKVRKYGIAVQISLFQGLVSSILFLPTILFWAIFKSLEGALMVAGAFWIFNFLLASVGRILMPTERVVAHYYTVKALTEKYKRIYGITLTVPESHKELDEINSMYIGRLRPQKEVIPVAYTDAQGTTNSGFLKLDKPKGEKKIVPRVYHDEKGTQELPVLPRA